MRHRRNSAFIACATVAGLVLTSGFTQSPPAKQAFPLTDTTGIVTRDLRIEVVDYLGRKAMRVTKPTPGGGYALLPGTDFQDGTIEADIALEVNVPPGVRMPGFVGIGFRGRADASHFELFYLRPGNARLTDQGMRSHSVQYSAEPDFGWYALRRQWPGLYESYVDLQMKTWTHVRIDVKGRTAALFVGGATQPTLIVDGLKGEDLRGAVALWGYAGEEAYFSNVRVTNVAPEPVKNGTDAAGTWLTRFVTDVGPFEGTLRLQRGGKNVTGVWSGAFGQSRPVTGLWREGYVELTFPAQWPGDIGAGRAGDAPVTLAGWFDGAAGRGQVRIDGRTDGTWTATRVP